MPNRRWDSVPVWGVYLKGDDITPVTGSVRLTLMQRVTRVDGRVIYPEGAVVERTIGDTSADPATRDAVRAAWRAADEAADGADFDGAAWDARWNVLMAGAVFASFPASDDPDIVQTGYEVKVEERLDSKTGKVYYIQPMLAHLQQTPPGINLGLFEVPPGAPNAPAPIYAKGLAGGVAALDFEGDVVDAFGGKVKGGGSPTGGAGGALAGTYPNPGLNGSAVDELVGGLLGDPDSETSVAARGAFETWLAEGGGGSGTVMLFDGNLAAARPAVDSPVVWFWPEDPANADDTQDHWVPVSLDGTGTGATAYTDEQVRDVIGTTIVAGAGITKTVNDAGDTVTIAATGGGGSANSDAVLGQYEPGRYITFPNAAGVAGLSLATLSRPTGVWLPVWRDVTVNQIGVEVTTAGGAGTTVAVALYKKRDGEATFDRVLTTGAVDASVIGFKEWAIDQALTPGRYLGLVAEMASPGGTMPQVRGLTGLGPFGALTRVQLVDPRGGVALNALGSPQVGAGWPTTLPLTDPGANITHSPAIYLRTA